MYAVKIKGMNIVLLRAGHTENTPVLFATNKKIFQDVEAFIFYTPTGRNLIDSINSFTTDWHYHIYNKLP